MLFFWFFLVFCCLKRKEKSETSHDKVKKLLKGQKVIKREKSYRKSYRKKRLSLDNVRKPRMLHGFSGAWSFRWIHLQERIHKIKSQI